MVGQTAGHLDDYGKMSWVALLHFLFLLASFCVCRGVEKVGEALLWRMLLNSRGTVILPRMVNTEANILQIGENGRCESDPGLDILTMFLFYILVLG